MIKLPNPSAFTDFIDQEIRYPTLIHFNKQELCDYLAFAQDQTDIHNPDHYGKPIIPGNMILAKLPFYIQQMIKVEQVKSVMTVSYDKISFKNPLHMDEGFQLSLTFTKVRTIKNTTHLSQQVKLSNPVDGALFSIIEIKDLYQ